jgi:hypothetical protein
MKTNSLLLLCCLALSVLAVRCGGSTNDSLDAALAGSDAETPGLDAEAVPPDAAALPGLDAGPALCDPSRCAAGNVCVQNKCMLTCTRHLDCPQPNPCSDGVGYDCRSLAIDPSFDAGFESVCTPNTVPYGPGMFGCGCGNGAPCATGFRCMGPQGTPSAYCSKANCTSDSDCPGNYWCATIEVLAPRDGGVADVGPRGDTGFTPPATVNLPVCVKRDFCAPASGYVDCNANDAVYAIDYKGRGWCLKQCDGSDPNGCGPGNGCIKHDSQYKCWPRGLTCAPSTPTHFCSRCLTNADCPKQGYCLSTWVGEPYCSSPCTSDDDCTYTGAPDDFNAGQCYQFSDGESQCMPNETASSDPTDPTPGAASCWEPLPGLDAGQVPGRDH